MHLGRVTSYHAYQHVNAGVFFSSFKISRKPESEFKRITLLNDYVDIVGIPKNSFFFLSIYIREHTHAYTHFGYKNRRYELTHTRLINNFPVDKTTNLEIQQHLAKSAIATTFMLCVFKITTTRCDVATANKQMRNTK